MTAVIDARDLSKSFGAKRALERVSFQRRQRTHRRADRPERRRQDDGAQGDLGLTTFEGHLSVLGLDPRTQRDELMREVCSMADAAVLSRWLR